MSKPSPGPYRVERRTDKRYGCKIVAPEIATRSAPLPAIATIHTPRSWGEADATANLLAAAPELREELAKAKGVIETLCERLNEANDWIEEYEEKPEKYTKGIDEAIARAEGRES